VDRDDVATSPNGGDEAAARHRAGPVRGPVRAEDEMLKKNWKERAAGRAREMNGTTTPPPSSSSSWRGVSVGVHVGCAAARLNV
jgi:hypothetical protein